MKKNLVLLGILLYSPFVLVAQSITDAVGTQHILRSDNTVDFFVKDKSIYTGKCTPPTFYGGNDMLQAYINKNLNSTDTTLSALIRCLINEEGMIEIPFVLKSSGSANFDEQALKLVDGMPDWKPAQAVGNAVKTYVTIAISRQNDSKIVAKIKRTYDIGTGEVFENNKIDETKQGNQMAKFINGESNLWKWLGQNMKYPSFAKENNHQGKATIKFVVEKDGHISSVTLEKSTGHTELDEESLRVIRMMPDWIPAMINGIIVRTSVTMPLVFRLEG